MKRCYNCKKTKPKTEFGSNVSKWDKLKSECLECNRELKAAWKKQNRDKVNAQNARRRVSKLNGMLKWGKEHLKPEIDNWYRRAKLATIFMEEPYQVDHIEPLQGKDVSGLHVPWNLTLLTKPENSAKGNRRAKEKSTTPVPAGSYIPGAVGAELGSVSTPWTWEDNSNIDYDSGTISGQDIDHSTKKGSGDSVAHGSTEVGTPQASQGIEDDWQLHPAYGWIKS